MGKHKLIPLFGTIQIFGCIINALSKYIFMQESGKFLEYLLVRKICFKMQSSIRRANHKTTMQQSGNKILFVRYG